MIDHFAEAPARERATGEKSSAFCKIGEDAVVAAVEWLCHEGRLARAIDGGDGLFATYRSTRKPPRSARGGGAARATSARDEPGGGGGAADDDAATKPKDAERTLWQIKPGSPVEARARVAL